jgi:hypothetical protein
MASLTFTIKPLQDRTGFHGSPKRSPFEASWSSTLELLNRELRHLGGSNVIIEVDVPPGAVRLDGMLYANAKVNSPGVRLHFDSVHGHLSYETDAFTHWQANVRAIALGLESLRRVDRYQIGRGGEQYRGYLALESGPGIALGGMTKDQAAELLERVAIGDEGYQRDRSLVLILGGGDTARRVFREARAMAHPDRRGGDQSLWDQVEQAGRVLGLTS